MPTSLSASAETPSNVPAFLSKLWRLVENPQYDSIISWGQNGDTFKIHDQTQFAKDVLPMYFKHNNMASFIRQLNMYGFRKKSPTHGGLKDQTEDIEFQHHFFNRGQEAALEFIKRKAPAHPKLPATIAPAIAAVPHDHELRAELVRELLTDVKQMQGKQSSVDTQLDEMKRENEALWREVAVLRRKHLKQQQIVEKLIHFLASLVHQARAGNAENNMSMKRKHTLMIDEGGKLRKTLRSSVPNRQVTATPPEARISEIDSGPIISDITYEQSMNDQRYNTMPSGGGKGTAMTTAPSDGSASQIVEGLITSPASTNDLTDEVVLCENLFDEEVDLAPCVGSAAPDSGVNYQPQTQMSQQQNSQQQQLQDFGKFDLDQTLNTPRVDWEEQSPIPGTSTKLTTGQTMPSNPSNTGTIPSMQVALQSPNKNTFKADPLNKNKDAFEAPKSSFSEDPTSRLHSKAMTEWQADRHVSIAQKLSSILNDHFLGAEQIKRINEDANRPTDNLHEHLEGVETELDWLQDQLLAGGLNIDSNTLMNIFNTDLASFADDNSGANPNSQVVQYQNPSFLDLIDEADDEENIKQLKAK